MKRVELTLQRHLELIRNPLGEDELSAGELNEGEVALGLLLPADEEAPCPPSRPPRLGSLLCVAGPDVRLGGPGHGLLPHRRGVVARVAVSLARPRPRLWERGGRGVGRRVRGDLPERA
jgi:hypothetical protein